MSQWIDRLFLVGIAGIVAVLAATALPALTGGHLGGNMLMLHMMASGAMVFGLPVLAIYFLPRYISGRESNSMQRTGYWLLIFTGLIAIATMFACMLPIPSTDQMHKLITLHGYAGFATVPAVALLLLGAWRWRRIQSMRSATPG